MPYKSDFSILDDKQAVYLDHAASSLTPDCVVDAMAGYYQTYRANVHRGVYPWSAKATIAYEDAREQVANFIGAKAPDVVFTQGATAGINIVAQSCISHVLSEGDVILISPLEHHANMIPWQRLAESKGAKIAYIPMNDQWEIEWTLLEEMVQSMPVKLIAMTHASNVLGVSFDIQRIAKLGPWVCVDGTQMVSHDKVDVKALGCHFYVFSAHKMYGPTGIGALYISPECQERVKPHFTGGGIVDIVTYEHATFQSGLAVLEPGTPNISGAIGFARACEYILHIGYHKIQAHESVLVDYLIKTVKPLNLETFGPVNHPVYAFKHPHVHPHDVATILGDSGVMVRAGHHCCMPLMDKLGVNALTRLSLGIYNQQTDIDQFVQGMQVVNEVMGV